MTLSTSLLDSLLAPATTSVGWSTAASVAVQLFLLVAAASGLLAFLQLPPNLPAAAPAKAIHSPVLLWLARLFLVRYAVLSFIAPVGLYLLGLWVMPQFTSSLHVVASQDASGQDSFDAWAIGKIALLLLAAVWQTTTAVLALRAACAHMRDRFGVDPWPYWSGSGFDRFAWPGVLVVALLPVALCCLHTGAEFLTPDAPLARLLGSRAWGILVLLLLVAATACAFRVAAKPLGPLPPGLPRWFESAVTTVLRRFGPGYLYAPQGLGGPVFRLYPEHRWCLNAFAITMVVYGLAFLIVCAFHSFAFFPVIAYFKFRTFWG